MLQITIGLDNPGSNSWGISYDRIRVFRFGVEVNSQVSTDDDPNSIVRTSFRSRREVTVKIPNHFYFIALFSFIIVLGSNLYRPSKYFFVIVRFPR